MLRVNGFYGHVQRNDLTSVVTFAGFLLAFQLGAAAMLALPLLVLDTAHSPLVPSAYALRYGPFVLLVGAALFAVRFVRHVASVQESVGFERVERRDEPRLVNLVETTAIAAGLPLPRVGLIESQACNAFACGLSPASAVVVVTRGLLDTLDDRELAAVIAHEIVHIRNGDIRRMAAANVLLDTLLLLQRGHVLKISNWRRAIVAVLLPPYLIVAALCGFLSNGAVVLARVSRLLIASSREFVADAEAVRLTQDPEALISALQRIEGRSTIPGLSLTADAMMIDGAVAGPFANHPPIAERIAVLARLSATLFGRRQFGLRTARTSQPFTVPDPLAPARKLVERVSDGSTENAFGIPRSAARVITIGFCLFGALQVWTMWHTRRQFAAFDARNAPVYAEGKRVGAALDRLGALPPIAARCFMTDTYGVGDRGLHVWKAIDGRLIDDYRRGRRRDDSIVMERYLAYRLKSIGQTEYGLPAERARALLDYVRTRELMLQVAHRYFGNSGLSVMSGAYDSPQDGVVLARLRTGLDAGTLPFAPNEAKLRGDVDLLLSAPTEFIPCRARVPAAGSTERRAPSSTGPRS